MKGNFSMLGVIKKLGAYLVEHNISGDELFEQWDSDSDGYIDGPELHKGLQAFIGEFLSPEQISIIIKTYDHDENNRIDVGELRKIIYDYIDVAKADESRIE